jgi:hypothetical protein
MWIYNPNVGPGGKAAAAVGGGIVDNTWTSAKGSTIGDEDGLVAMAKREWTYNPKCGLFIAFFGIGIKYTQLAGDHSFPKSVPNGKYQSATRFGGEWDAHQGFGAPRVVMGKESFRAYTCAVDSPWGVAGIGGNPSETQTTAELLPRYGHLERCDLAHL